MLSGSQGSFFMKNKIPEQHSGVKHDTVSEVVLETEQLAKEHFELVKKRFLDVNSWEMFAGEEKASFSVRDQEGKLILEPPKVGNYFRIQIPGLHNASGDGFDWVIVEEMEEESSPHVESIFLRVRPSEDPTENSTTTTHFFCEKATSNFIIKREHNKVSAEVHGRNEEPNTEEVSTIEKVRNFLVAVGGIIGGSKFQWKSLTEGLIKNE